MNPVHSEIQDVPSGQSLAAIRSQARAVRKLMQTAVEDDATTVAECSIKLKADTLAPGLMFVADGRQFFFPVNNRWFKRAKSELAAVEAVARSVKNRDRA